MNGLTLSALLGVGGSQHTKESVNFMAINVSVYGNVPETIVNPKANIETKLAYYQEAYNEDLTLKSNGNIRIVKYAFVETAEELVQMFS